MSNKPEFSEVTRIVIASKKFVIIFTTITTLCIIVSLRCLYSVLWPMKSSFRQDKFGKSRVVDRFIPKTLNLIGY
jgi:hypothetical protein